MGGMAQQVPRPVHFAGLWLRFQQCAIPQLRHRYFPLFLAR
jgi:hypothetical protein